MSSEQVGKPWGSIIGATLLIQAVNLIGLLVVIGSRFFCKKDGPTSATRSVWVRIGIPAFAAGALLATTVFLLIPESIELLEGGHAEHEEEGQTHDDHDNHRQLLFRLLEEEHHDDHDDHDDHDEHEEDEHAALAWKFGVAFLSGFLLPALLSKFTTNHHHVVDDIAVVAVSPKETSTMNKTAVNKNSHLYSDEVRDYSEDGDADDDKVVVEDTETTGADCDTGDCDLCDGGGSPACAPKPRIDVSLACSVLLGDFCHNFSDGIFVGTAFLLCDKRLAWAVTLSTVWHELAQELADFFILTEHCNFSPSVALATNFLAGTSVVLGGIAVAWIDFSTEMVGIILTIAAGVYVYVAASECIPKITVQGESHKDTVVFFLSFAAGAIPIGLVLLNHGHCEH